MPRGDRTIGAMLSRGGVYRRKKSHGVVKGSDCSSSFEYPHILLEIDKAM